MKLSYKFAEPLSRGVILSRPNRFIMMVRHKDEVLRCHCPVTGNIAHLNFEGSEIPCLISKNTAKTAKTSHTVEAISLDPTKDKNKNPEWFGINQNRANRIVEHFLEQGLLFVDKSEDRKGKEMKITREVKVGESKLDFLCESSSGEKHYVEVKSPVHWVETETHPNFDAGKVFKVSTLSDRLMKHYAELGRLRETARCSVLLFFMYDAKPFSPQKRDQKSKESKRPASFEKRLEQVMEVVRSAETQGVERWQLNVKITPEEVLFLNHFKLDVGYQTSTSQATPKGKKEQIKRSSSRTSGETSEISEPKKKRVRTTRINTRSKDSA